MSIGTMASASSSSTCDCSAATANEPVVDTRTSNALCPNRPPPRVAICVVGAARTFPQEQAWRSLKRNLIEGFGGIGLDSPSPDVFMHLKLVDDAPKEQREWRFDPLTRRLDQPLCAAACAFQPTALVLSANGSHAGPTRPNALARGCFRSGFFGHTVNLMRAVSQWSSFAACHESLAAHEAKHGGRRYDVVALTRPDTVWYAGVKPHCLHELRETTVVHRGPPRWNSTLEWLLLMPRRHAASILNTALLFDSCTPGQPCCGIARSEDLLSFALARTGRWRHEPFGVDILRGSQHAAMRNAGCMQPDTLGFATFEHCRQVLYGLPAGAPVVAPAKPKQHSAAKGGAGQAPTASAGPSVGRRDHHHGVRRPPHSG